MADESIEQLITDPTGVYVDATLGMGGYSERILKILKPEGKLFGFDVDDDALENSGIRLVSYKNFHAIQANFSSVKVGLFQYGIKEIDGIVFDLGVSSLMLDKAEKGFSYRFNGPLDMRMNKELDLTAESIVNDYDEEALTKIFFTYGEERFSRKIARYICKSRKNKKLQNTNDLADIIRSTVFGPHVNKSLSRIFQALRMEVNDEVENLKKALIRSVELLKPGGRLVVLSYHSIEDRIVKEFIKDLTTDCICPPKSPICTCDHRATMKVPGPRRIKASAEEVKKNKRSRSAVLRVAEKLPIQEIK